MTVGEEVAEEMRQEKEQATRPPEWWTEANTEAWHREVWGNPQDWGLTQRVWGGKMQGADKAGPLCYKPLTNKELVEMRKADPRPANAIYYDGRPILKYKPLTVKRATRKAAHV